MACSMAEGTPIGERDLVVGLKHECHHALSILERKVLDRKALHYLNEETPSCCNRPTAICC